MRSAPVARPGVEHHPFEFRVRFHAPLRRVVVVPPNTDLPDTHTQTEHEPPSTPPASPPANVSPPTSPTDFWPADALHELSADRERIEAVLKSVQDGVANLRDERTGRIQDWQRAAIELAMTIASRLLHERVESGDFPMDAKIRDMIAQLGEDVPVVVRLNPLDLELLKSRLKRAGDESLLTGPDAPRFVADSTLDRGECQVEGRESMLLSDVSRELQEIRDELLRSLNNARS